MGHSFHIPVMGTGFSVDTPIRVAHFGISSVISLADDLLLEKIRKCYSEKFNFPYERISGSEDDGRARRITAYLDLVGRIVRMKMEKIKGEPFFQNNDKRTYFEMLPPSSSLRRTYDRLMDLMPGRERDALAADLTDRMVPGAIDVNIMVKVDRMNYGADGRPLDEIYSDARAALRGYAHSNLEASSMVFSAGINKGLFRYMSRFREFYRDSLGNVKKKITVKVSDFRSALLQGKFLAQMGLEVSEYRIESGLNCGGHAFGSGGRLLSSILAEFKEKRAYLSTGFRNQVAAYYEKKGWAYSQAQQTAGLRVTVQGGIGTHGEACRLMETYGVDAVGWGTPFLLVPEAVCVDNELFELLKNAGPEDLYLSGISPLGVPFNNLRNTTSEKWTRRQTASGRPGSVCPKQYLVSNTEFTENPICTASRTYQEKMLRQIDAGGGCADEKRRCAAAVLEKTCLCDHLGNSALMALGVANPSSIPTVVCPGPNLAWFNRLYSLREMVDHIYGRGERLAAPERPHMLAQEFVLSVDHFSQLAAASDGSPAGMKRLKAYRETLEREAESCRKIAAEAPYPGENLDSIVPCIEVQVQRLQCLWQEVLGRDGEPDVYDVATDSFFSPADAEIPNDRGGADAGKYAAYA